MDRSNGFFENKPYSGETDNDRMNSWKEEQISPADTYIEWFFEHKCKQLSNGFQIITEWRIRKQQYIQITNTTIFDFQHYSRHDATHSITILESIELLLGKKRIDTLSAGDLWLLLEAAYSHDVGMARNYEELLDLWEKNEDFQEFIRDCISDDFGDISEAALYYKQADNLLRNRSKMENLQDCEEVDFQSNWPVLSQKYILILVGEYIRKSHAERSVRLLNEMDVKRESVIPTRLYQVASMVSQMHGKGFDDILHTLKYSEKGFGTGMIHPQFVAAMLRIGDLLDIDNNRFDPYAVAHFGRLPLVSLLHMKKHKAITHIVIAESEISVEARTNEYAVGLLVDNWFHMIDEEVKNLICNWNVIVPKSLIGCTLRQSQCRVYLLGKNETDYQMFDARLQRKFTINKKKLIKLMIGTSFYDGEMDFLREYLQNAMDASKMQLWIDLENGKYEYLRNQNIMEYKELSPLDLDSSVYRNYIIKISVEWNPNNDKIQLKIIDQGIGIEKAYLNSLSDIGTGWRGRNCYKNELKKMAKWLYPTGGFGVGIQSAFMVADSIEILTKSDKDINGHKIILQSPDKVGSVSAEELPRLSMRGTTVMIELEPEKIQNWAKYITKYSSNYDNSVKSDQAPFEFDREKWDEFDRDAVLLYAQDIIYYYVTQIIPNALIPIEVSCSAGKGKLYYNSYMSHIDYWKESSRCIAKKINEEDRKYQCIFITDLEKVIIWEAKDCIFYKIDLNKIELIRNNKDFEHQLCFKNIFVCSSERYNFEVYRRVGMCIDFMGFKAEQCLKIHRNSFFDEFSLENYYHDGFRVLIQFLKEYNEQGKEVLAEYLQMYSIQLICLLKFYDLYDEKFTATDRLDNDCVVYYEFAIDKENNLVGNKIEKSIRRSMIIEHVQKFYQTIISKKNDEDREQEQGILLALKKGKKYPFEESKTDKILIHPNKIKKWLQTGSSLEQGCMDEKEIKNAAVRDLALDSLQDNQGAICDDYAITALLLDSRLDKKIICIAEDDSYDFLLLRKKEKKREMGKGEIYTSFWSEGKEKGRKFVTCSNLKEYSNLFVSTIPYQKDLPEKGTSFLLSPISYTAYQNVIGYKEMGKKLDYDQFRAIVWGKKGQEFPDYHMLINWVVKHQLEGCHARIEEVKEIYEKLLQDIYQECVHDK